MKSNKFASIAFTVLSFVGLNSCTDSGSYFEDIDLIPITLSQDGKWSMINDKGEIIYDNEFKNMPTVAYNGFFSVEEEGGVTVYSIGSKSPKAVRGLEKLKAAGFMNEGLMPVTFQNSRISIVNENGEVKFELSPIKGKEVISCYTGFVEGLLLFTTEENKIGYCNTSGKVPIAPKYDFATTFSEGLAIVGECTDSEDVATRRYSVINKEGEEVFKISNGYQPVYPGRFINGYMIALKDDRFCLIDKEGEYTNLPSKINNIKEYNGKYIIFESEGEFGVADYKGEIIVRPKYEDITFKSNNKFFAIKDKEIRILNSKGEETDRKLDYDAIYALGKFGYMVQDGKTMILLDSKLNKKSKEDFYDINISLTDLKLNDLLGGQSTIQSDYLCVSRIISEIVDNIDGDKIYNLTLGESAPLVMSGKDPKDYLHQESFELENTQQKGSKYEINVKAVFTESLTHADIDYDGYQYNIIETWNPNSILCGFIIQIETKLEWGKLGAQSLCSALAKYGFKYAVGEKKIDGEGGGGFIRKGHIWGSMEYASHSCKLMFIDLNVVPNSEAFIESLIAKLPSEQREELREP